MYSRRDSAKKGPEEARGEGFSNERNKESQQY
jgi:hypothetical protein